MRRAIIARFRRKLARVGVIGLASETLERSDLIYPRKPFSLEPPSRNGFERIYHLHIRKCGGTSVNKMFIAAFTRDVERAYLVLAQNPRHYIEIGGFPFVGWNRNLIKRGAYFFAFSHWPLHSISLSEKTYTFSLVRDPVDRVLSHYKMLLSMVRLGASHPSLDEEGKWIEGGFQGFLERVPKEHLCNQLYMFSRNFSVPEALQNAKRITNLRPLSQVDRLVSDLNQEFGLELQPIHTRRADVEFEPSATELRILRNGLRDEIEFYDKLNLT